MTIVAVFVGPAGTGKTSLVNIYGKWLERELFLRVAVVNMDPGAENIPYNPVFDIREWFTLKDIMKKYGLGPNGAFLKSSELIAEKIDGVMRHEPFSNIEQWDVLLVDTPGQMEAFIFRPSSTVFFKSLSKISNPVTVFIIDASAIKSISDAVTLWFLGVLTQAKLGTIVVPVINKIDAAENLEYARLLVEDPEKLMHIAEKQSYEGIISEVVPELVSIAIKTRGAYRPVLVSAKTGQGIDELHYLIHEAFCTCGDLT